MPNVASKDYMIRIKYKWNYSVESDGKISKDGILEIK